MLMLSLQFKPRCPIIVGVSPMPSGGHNLCQGYARKEDMKNMQAFPTLKSPTLYTEREKILFYAR